MLEQPGKLLKTREHTPRCKKETPFLLQCLFNTLPDRTLATNRVQVHLTELNIVLSKGPTPIFIAQSGKDKFKSSKVFFQFTVYILYPFVHVVCVWYMFTYVTHVESMVKVRYFLTHSPPWFAFGNGVSH